MLRWKSSLKPAAAASADIALEASAVTTATSFSTPTNVDVNIPAVSTNDILILFVSTDSPEDPTSSPPSGWTKIAEQDGINSFDSTVAAYWKRASSGSTATTETWSSFFPEGAKYYIWVGAYSGCVNSGSPVDAYGTAALGHSSSWSVNVTTTVTDTMIVTVSGTTHTAVTQTWTDGTELIDTAYQSGACVSINEKLEATSGAKTRTSTPSPSTSASMIAVALKKPAVVLTPDFDENFEGTGTPTSWSTTIVGSGTVDYDYTTDPGTGSKSLEVITSGGDSYSEVDLGSVYGKFELIFQNKVFSGASNRNWISGSKLSSYSTNESFSVGFVDGWNYGLLHGANKLTRSTTAVAIGDWHWVKLFVDYANTAVTLTISASSDFSSPDVASSTSFSFNAAFSGVRYLKFGGNNRAMSVWVDEFSAYDL
jgi:hypothetical protein